MSDTTDTAVDLQDPLPESNWFWRRVFVFAVTACVLWFLWGAITRLGAVAVMTPELGVPALMSLCRWIITLTGIMATYYMVAPSAEQIVKMLKVAALLRSGVQVTGKQVVRTPDAVTETAKAAGYPPISPETGAGEAIAPSTSSTPAPESDGPPWTVMQTPPPPPKG